MKKIFRMLVFSGLAIWLTGWWNKGFIVSYDWRSFLTAAAAVAVLFYLINPIAKLILLPVNILTLGLISVIVYFLLFHFVITNYSLLTIKGWTFDGLAINGFTVNKISIGYYVNVGLSALSISMIINFLEALL